MAQIDGLMFFNGGAQAGASVQHRHLQIAPFDAPLLQALLPDAAADHAAQQLARLPFAHALVKFDSALPASTDAAGARLHDAYQGCLEHCGLAPASDGRLPPYNLLATRECLLLVPRSRETWDDGDTRVSLNAMSFAGSIFVRDPALAPRIRQAGILRLLRSVTFPSHTP